MPVFISHSSTDDALARAVAQTLRNNSIEVYLDDWDPDAARAADITEHLVQHIARCSHLMVILSTTTKDSWWVPFEIGVAREATKRITSLLTTDVYNTLPAFLKVWPVLRNTAQLQQFIQAYRKDASVSIFEKTAGLSESQRLSTSFEFHASLKRALGQT